MLITVNTSLQSVKRVHCERAHPKPCVLSILSSYVWFVSCLCDSGGVSPDERGLVWRFLFGMYPCSSTALERPLLLEQMAVRYQVMKRKWQQLLPGAVRLRLNGTDGKLYSWAEQTLLICNGCPLSALTTCNKMFGLDIENLWYICNWQVVALLNHK